MDYLINFQNPNKWFDRFCLFSVLISMPLEIERKWLLKCFPENAHNKLEIEQGYLLISATGDEARIRRKGDRFFLTFKSSGDLIREEIEIELDQHQFNALWPLTKGKRISKTRYKIEVGERTLEVDLFHESLEGLALVEVEFPSEKDSEQFALPPWFGAEVTNDKRYKNQSLALLGRPSMAI